MLWKGCTEVEESVRQPGDCHREGLKERCRLQRRLWHPAYRDPPLSETGQKGSPSD